MPRISRVEMEHLCKEITDHAVTLGLLPPGAKVHWIPGGQGIAPSTPVTVGGERQGFLATSFLPEFGYRDTTRDAFRALTATYKVLSVLAEKR